MSATDKATATSESTKSATATAEETKQAKAEATASASAEGHMLYTEGSRRLDYSATEDTLPPACNFQTPH